MVTTDIKPILEKIDDLKTDFNNKFSELSKRLDKYENQNLANFEKVIKAKQHCESLQAELNEHKKNDQFYGVKQSEKIEGLEKDLNDKFDKTKEQNFKLKLYIIISALAGGGVSGGVIKIISKFLGV